MAKSRRGRQKIIGSMISTLVILLAYFKKLWWLVFAGVAIQDYLDYRTIKKLEKRIEELEHENLHR